MALALCMCLAIPCRLTVLYSFSFGWWVKRSIQAMALYIELPERNAVGQALPRRLVIWTAPQPQCCTRQHRAARVGNVYV